MSFSCFWKTNFLDTELVSIPSNLSTQRSTLIIKFLLPLEKKLWWVLLAHSISTQTSLKTPHKSWIFIWSSTRKHSLGLDTRTRTSFPTTKECSYFRYRNYHPKYKTPIFYSVDASFFELGAVPFQLNEENKMKVISYISRILNPQEQKHSIIDREFLGIVHALEIYEVLIIWSPHPVHIFTDHKPLLHCFTKKPILHPQFIVQKCS